MTFLKGLGLKKSVTSVITPATVHTLEDVGDSNEFQDAKEQARPAELDEAIIATGQAGCDYLEKIGLEEGANWSLWSDKGGVKVETYHTSQSNSVCGRGTYMYKPKAPLTLDLIEEALWQEDAKNKYDEFTDSMVCFFTLNDQLNVTCQSFKGRFGFSGRYFHLVIQRKKVDDGKYERLVLGARSLADQWLDLARQNIERDEAAVKLKTIEDKLVIGFAYVAGIIVERNKETGELKIIYVNDADVVTKGVPKWIVDRVKIDQLKVVKNIPQVLEEYYVKKQTEQAETAMTQAA